MRLQDVLIRELNEIWAISGRWSKLKINTFGCLFIRKHCCSQLHHPLCISMVAPEDVWTIADSEGLLESTLLGFWSGC